MAQDKPTKGFAEYFEERGRKEQEERDKPAEKAEPVDHTDKTIMTRLSGYFRGLVADKDTRGGIREIKHKSGVTFEGSSRWPYIKAVEGKTYTQAEVDAEVDRRLTEDLTEKGWTAEQIAAYKAQLAQEKASKEPKGD